jgi:hypothetical protein
MRRGVTVELGDLKVLIEIMFEKDVRKLAETKVTNQPKNFCREAALEFDREVSEVLPEARKTVAARYRHLREALEIGKDVAHALKTFVRRD